MLDSRHAHRFLAKYGQVVCIPDVRFLFDSVEKVHFGKK
jgi:hypothetical protein